ncbi:MAG: GIY-YIG nuclease family protein [Clostridiales bacterium]|nr:GIY-YIG nuclease family protein [Clostridiales bacterium]
MKKEYFVYLLRCADDTLYCGYTDNLINRLQCHNAKKGAKYTKSRLPVTLAYFERQNSKSDALKREHAIKKMSRQEKLALINSKQMSINIF